MIAHGRIIFVYHRILAFRNVLVVIIDDYLGQNQKLARGIFNTRAQDFFDFTVKISVASSAPSDYFAFAESGGGAPRLGNKRNAVGGVQTRLADFSAVFLGGGLGKTFRKYIVDFGFKRFYLGADKSLAFGNGVTAFVKRFYRRVVLVFLAPVVLFAIDRRRIYFNLF